MLQYRPSSIQLRVNSNLENRDLLTDHKVTKADPVEIWHQYQNHAFTVKQKVEPQLL